MNVHRFEARLREPAELIKQSGRLVDRVRVF